MPSKHTFKRSELSPDCYHGILKLAELRASSSLLDALGRDAFPSVAMLLALDKKFGESPTVSDMRGLPMRSAARTVALGGAAVGVCVARLAVLCGVVADREGQAHLADAGPVSDVHMRTIAELQGTRCRSPQRVRSLMSGMYVRTVGLARPAHNTGRVQPAL
jgi:hypothetical protein